MSLSIDALKAEIRRATPGEPETLSLALVESDNEPCTNQSRNVLATVDQLKEASQDFEWYPTTDEMLRKIAAHWRGTSPSRHYGNGETSILDIGAGDGHALSILGKETNATRLLAIEKSEILANQMPADIFLIGSDILSQTLYDKKASFTFCNPPYSEYAEWMIKIISESQSERFYFVVPTRWKDHEGVSAAIESRSATVTTLGTFDFIQAERSARAKVEILCLTIPTRKADSFRLWIESEFSELVEKEAQADTQAKQASDRRTAIVQSEGNFCKALVEAYIAEMALLQENYLAIGKLDAVLLKELQINVSSIADIMFDRIGNLKKAYWKLLFENLENVTNRLTAKNRKAMLETLFDSTHVDFTEANISLVVGWIARNANHHITGQLVTVFETMVSKANVKNYKSNQRVFGDGYRTGWRFRQELEEGRVSHIKLDYRLVIENQGGAVRAGDYWHTKENGLNVRGMEFLQDVNTVADNLGLGPKTSPKSFQWRAGQTREFFSHANKLLFDVRAFYNGNLHMRLSKEFALALNVEYGRLKGWVLNPGQAAEEMGDKDATKYFGSIKAIDTSELTTLMLPQG